MPDLFRFVSLRSVQLASESETQHKIVRAYVPEQPSPLHRDLVTLRGEGRWLSMQQRATTFVLSAGFVGSIDSLGGRYATLGQWLSSRQDLISRDDIVEQFSIVFDLSPAALLQTEAYEDMRQRTSDTLLA